MHPDPPFVAYEGRLFGMCDGMAPAWPEDFIDERGLDEGEAAPFVRSRLPPSLQSEAWRHRRWLLPVACSAVACLCLMSGRSDPASSRQHDVVVEALVAAAAEHHLEEREHAGHHDDHKDRDDHDDHSDRDDQEEDGDRSSGNASAELAVAKAAAFMAQQLASAEAAAVQAARVAEQARLETLCGGEDGNVNCAKSRCCKKPGHQCYAQNDTWAECLQECTPGPNLFDHRSSSIWSCKPLGGRAGGTPKKCADDTENCIDTACCASLGMQCYRKNATFGVCKASCEPGFDMADEDWAPWSCEEVGNRTKVPAPWIESFCAKGPENCAWKQCCVEEGFQCYLGNKYWGQCKPRCDQWQWDACAPIGSRAPKLASAIMSAKRRVGSWVEQRCAAKGENCAHSGCCHEVGTTCFKKDEKYATCMESCNSTMILEDRNETWSCDALGPTSWGLATRGYPSLYCISLYMPESYEGPLLKSVLSRGAGIFACDGFDVFANHEDELGATESGVLVKPLLIPRISVGVSQDGTAGNAELFMAVWDKVIAQGRFRNYDWTIKVDPDAVVLPWRLRDHLASHIGKNVYVVNCDKYPMSPNFPMMYGALEIFSQAAMATYSENSDRCGKELPWHPWGEDYFMTHCMDYIGVSRISDFGVLGDNVCLGSHCGDPAVAAFHPFKTQSTWHRCWNAANGLPDNSLSDRTETS